MINDTVLGFYGIARLRFTEPLFAGDTVRVTKRVTVLRAKDEDCGVVTFATHVLNQSGEPVIVYVDKLLAKRKK